MHEHNYKSIKVVDVNNTIIDVQQVVYLALSIAISTFQCIFLVSWKKNSVVVASGNRLLYLSPDAVGLNTFVPIITVDNGIFTALALDWFSRTVFFAVDDVSRPGGMAKIARFELNDTVSEYVWAYQVCHVISVYLSGL